MINRFYHAATSAVVQFSCNPSRGNGEQAQRFQTSGYDSSGNTYVYSKNSVKRGLQTLVYPHQLQAVLIDLITFIQVRSGDKSSFTWYDHDAVLHTVRFSAGNLSYKQTEPGRYRIEIKISEDKP